MEFYSKTTFTIGPRRKPKRVLITGFGPFPGAPYNVSWAGVASMNKCKIQRENRIRIRREEIGVRYRDVDVVVPALWQRLLPHFAIHVGVHPDAQSLHLETNARNTGYEYPDVDGRMPSSSEIVPGGCAKITTTFDVERICEEFNENPPAPNLEAIVSHDAQLYLCEYIYYTSLCRGPTLFVHVPLNKYSGYEIALGLERILELCLQNARF